jgi:CRP-like cAMP-binding protein
MHFLAVSLALAGLVAMPRAMARTRVVATTLECRLRSTASTLHNCDNGHSMTDARASRHERLGEDRRRQLSDRFLAHVLSRNIRIEEDLVDQLFNSSEKRLARALPLLARSGKDDTPVRTIPALSQEILAEMVGTMRWRVNFFMNKFRKLGFIEYNGGIKINKSLLSVVLHD